ncbi:MAG: aminoacyl-tRNA hydrolase [Gemmatimonadaceae bacterium]
MKVILGLGNPGKEYANTRHNVGWWVVDHLADVWRLDGWRKDGEALTSSGAVGAIKVRLVKPQTFMNLSGAVLKPWLRRPFWAAATDLLVISDEVQLPVGTYRFRARGSAGGHNGLKSIEQALGSQEYARLRIGVGPSDPQRRVGDLADFVLGEFGKQEAADTRALLPTFDTALQQWAKQGIGPVMNTFNSTT